VTEEDSVLAVEGVEESPLDVFHEECGVFGVYRHPEAANLAYLGLYAQQHRGQESAGIVSSNGKSLIFHHGMGLVADVFDSATIANLEGTSAIGHNRYSTTGTNRAVKVEIGDCIGLRTDLGSLQVLRTRVSRGSQHAHLQS